MNPRYQIRITRHLEPNGKWSWSIVDQDGGGCTADQGKAWDEGYDFPEEAAYDAEQYARKKGWW